MPEVTVVIPLFEKGPHIARALDSVLSQTFADFEVVVVDDGSTDDGKQVVTKYLGDPRIRLLVQENRGVSAARNRGIDEAFTDFIAFLDADDEWAPDHLEILVRLRMKFPGAGICTTAFRRVLEDGRIVFPRYEGIPSPPWEGILEDYFKSASLGAQPVWTSAAAVPLAVFRQIGLFRVGISRGEDLDMWGRIAMFYPVAFSWEGIGYYRKDATQRTCDKVPMQESHPFLDSVREHYGSESRAPYFVRYYLNRKRLERTSHLIAAGKKMEAVRYLLSPPPFPCSMRSFRKILSRLLGRGKTNPQE